MTIHRTRYDNFFLFTDCVQSAIVLFAMGFLYVQFVVHDRDAQRRGIACVVGISSVLVFVAAFVQVWNETSLENHQQATLVINANKSVVPLTVCIGLTIVTIFCIEILRKFGSKMDKIPEILTA